MKRHAFWLSLLIVLCAGLANAAPEHDNFERGEDSQDSYYKAIKRILWQGWRRDVVLRMIVRPPFDKEHILGVRRVGQQYRCFVVNPSSHIWSEEVKRHTAGAGKPDFSHIRGEFDETPVREDFVLRIARIWRKGINDPKSYLSAAEKDRSIYLDSTQFYFLVAGLPHERLTAHTVESAGRNADAMIRVGFDLPRYVWHDITEAAFDRSLARAERTMGIKTNAMRNP